MGTLTVIKNYILKEFQGIEKIKYLNADELLIEDIQTYNSSFYDYMENTPREENKLLKFIAEIYKLSLEDVDHNLYEGEYYEETNIQSYDFKIHLDRYEV